MIGWIKNISKESPEFWKKYISKFEKKTSRYVVINLETTGKNSTKDVILSIGAVAIINNNVVINDGFEVVIQQYKFLHDNDLTEDFNIESKQPKLAEPEALKAFIDYIGNAVLVGHRIYFEVEMINEALSKIDCGRLKNEALDVEIMHRKLIDVNDKNFAIEDLIKEYNLPKNEYFSVSDLAYSIALLFLKLKSRLGI